MMGGLSGKAAIAGMGATEFSKNSGRSELQLAVEAISIALADAGLTAADVDGMATFTMDNNPENEVMRNLGGSDLNFFTRVHYGGGAACAPLQQAAMAVATGVCKAVVCYRAMNERSEARLGGPVGLGGFGAEAQLVSYHTVHGLQTAAAMMAMSMRRYMHETGATSRDFAHVSVTARHHAATNPNAYFYGKPITIEDHQNSRPIADPLRLLDCCQESDGAVAFVVTSAERARDLKQRPVIIRAAAQGATRDTQQLTSYYRPDISPTDEVRLIGDQLYAMAGLAPADMQLAILYDHFGPAVLPQLEGYGFCKPGEAKDFVKDGNIAVGGTLPVNTHGGQLGEAYIHGMNGIAEAVRQLRGTAVNQVSDVHNVLVSAGNGLPSSGAILSTLP
ncbi:lipid-transfer protein [Novosphingobium kaempferiae]|uniref:lipid-transfer protein n=1 Tax=Novosphingobium kaempferiae TaxID=2896849 RepID=UPI001E4D9DDD|nr:lipid-transfer protein [Novosphingobium kaempferiae]